MLVRPAGAAPPESAGGTEAIVADAGAVYVIFGDAALTGTVDLSRVANGLGDEIASPLGQRNTHKPFEHPYYWAAFVLIGAPE